MAPSTAICRVRRSCSCSSYASPFSMAFWKIVGLLVTPTTCFLWTSSCRFPVRSRSRLMSSSQMETPSSDSCANASLISCPLSVPCRSAPDATSALQGGVSSGHNVVRGEPELLEEHVALGARAEVVDRDDFAAVADDLPPTLRDAGFDAHPRLDVGRQHLLLVGRRLGPEPLDARHRDHPHRRAVGLEDLSCLQG